MIAYPTARLADAKSFLASQPADGPPVPSELPVTWTNAGDKYDTATLERLGREAFEECGRLGLDNGAGNKKGEEFEGDWSPRLRRGLDDIPASVLTDRSFWRYLAVGPFYEAVRWRHGHANQPGYGCAPSKQVECLPWRLFMRAIIGHEDTSASPYRLSAVQGTDLWWSHILRIQIGRSKPTAQAILRLVADTGMRVSDIRDLAPRITRLRSTVLFEALTDEEVDEAVKREDPRA